MSQQDVINQVVQLLSVYSPELAQKWEKESWNRVTLARAFAAGFVGSEAVPTVYDDPHPHAQLVLNISMNLQEIEIAQNHIDMLEAEGY
jgi:hypothetical protein